MHSGFSQGIRTGLLARPARQESARPQFRCRVVFGGEGREERIFAAIPSIGSRIALSSDGRMYRVTHVRTVENGRQGVDPQAIVYTRRLRGAASATA